MAVRCNGNGAWPRVAFFDHDLVTYATPGREKVYPLLAGELFYLLVFLQVRFALVLNVMVESLAIVSRAPRHCSLLCLTMTICLGS